MNTQPRQPAVTATGLRKSYGKKVVLDGIDLNVPDGTVFAQLGPNGAGKTTTVQILSTLLGADGGRRSGSWATATGSSSGPPTDAPPTGSATPSPPEPDRSFAGVTAYDVAFTEADDGDLASVDAAYRAKYGGYASIVDHLQGNGPRAATLQVHPA